MAENWTILKMHTSKRYSLFSAFWWHHSFLYATHSFLDNLFCGFSEIPCQQKSRFADFWTDFFSMPKSILPINIFAWSVTFCPRSLLYIGCYVKKSEIAIRNIGRFYWRLRFLEGKFYIYNSAGCLTKKHLLDIR